MDVAIFQHNETWQKSHFGDVVWPLQWNSHKPCMFHFHTANL